MSFRSDEQSGYYDRFGRKRPSITARNAPADGRLTGDAARGPNRPELTCPGCEGHRIHTIERPLYKNVPPHATFAKPLRQRIGTEVRAYCLDCGRNWEESRDARDA